jgi:hypothetical protein
LGGGRPYVYIGCLNLIFFAIPGPSYPWIPPPNFAFSSRLQADRRDLLWSSVIHLPCQYGNGPKIPFQKLQKELQTICEPLWQNQALVEEMRLARYHWKAWLKSNNLHGKLWPNLHIFRG